MGIIALEGLEFFAYHGYYEEEQKIGNRYQVDIQITTDFSEAAEEDKLGGTVNYEDLYRIIASIMKDKIKLLEH
ncbi:MAG: dihydroneopterin aldolase, partial [Flectobacillus sp.]|nr:dihydroneopterin aldolase [Flectobacillus sp.]